MAFDLKTFVKEQWDRFRGGDASISMGQWQPSAGLLALLNRPELVVGIIPSIPDYISDLTPLSTEEISEEANELLGLEAGTLTAENLGVFLGYVRDETPEAFNSVLAELTGTTPLQVYQAVYDYSSGKALESLGIDAVPTNTTDPNWEIYFRELQGIMGAGGRTRREAAEDYFRQNGYEPSNAELEEVLSGDDYPTRESIGAYVDPRQVTNDEVIERLERLGVDVEAQAEAAGQTPEEYAEQIKESMPPGDGSEAAFDESMIMSLTSTAAGSGSFKESITKLATGVRNILFGTGPGGRPKTWLEILEEQIERKYFPNEFDLPGFPLEIVFEPGGASPSNPTGALVRANVKIPVPLPVNGPPIVIPLFDENGTYIGPSTPSGLLIDPETGIITQVKEGIEQTVAQVTGEAVQILGAAGDVVRSFPLWMLENPDWKEGDPNPFEIEVDENGDIAPQVDENGTAATGFDPETGLPVYEQLDEDPDGSQTRSPYDEGQEAADEFYGNFPDSAITPEDLEAQKEEILDTLGAQLTDLGIAVEDVEAILGNIETQLEDVATVEDLDNLRTQINTDLEEDLADLGLDIEEVQDVVDTISEDVDALATELEGVDEAIETLSGDVTALGESLDTRIEALIEAGATQSEAIEQAISDLASDLGTTEENILEQLGTTEANLAADIAAVSGDVTALGESLDTRIDELIEAGATQSEAIEQAISDLASDLGTTEENILEQLGTTEANLSAQIDTTNENIATLSELVTLYADQGFENDEALAQAIADLSDQLGTTEEGLLETLGETEETLMSAIAEVNENIAGVSEQIDLTNVNINDLNELVTFYADQGLENDEALAQAISDLSGRLDTTEENLLTVLGETEESILDAVAIANENIAATNANILTLNELVVQYEADGKSRDEALNLAINDLSDQLGITADTLLESIGETEETILTRIEESDDNTDEYLTYISNIIGVPVSEITQEDVDGIVGLLGEEEAITDINNDIRLYDANFDGVINDVDIGLLQGFVDAGVEGVGEIPATGLYADAAQRQLELQGYIDDSDKITRGLIEQEGKDTRQLVGQTALVNALASSGDLGGTRVDVSTPDPARINYIYDFSDIFATPQQKGLFPSPYGGPQRAQQQQIAQRRGIMSGPMQIGGTSRGPLQIGGMAQGGKVDYDFTDEIMQIMSYGDNQ